MTFGFVNAIIGASKTSKGVAVMKKAFFESNKSACASVFCGEACFSCGSKTAESTTCGHNAVIMSGTVFAVPVFVFLVNVILGIIISSVLNVGVMVISAVIISIIIADLIIAVKEKICHSCMSSCRTI